MIGLFGGTFDPVHFGHLRPALDVMEALSLDELRFIPAHSPPLRGEPVVTSVQRAEMVKLAIADLPGFVLDSSELEREGPSYTVDTLRFLRKKSGKKIPLVLLLGSDAFAKLTQWQEWEMITTLAHIAVMMRPDAALNDDDFPQGWLSQRLTDSHDLLRATAAGRITTVAVTRLAISATDIRERLAAGQSIRYLTPAAVCDYIEVQDLY